jgi:ABC-2 type transport system ATP-binding protein
MDYAVETIGLTKVFSDWWGRAKVFAVNDLNLQIRHNEVFGLLGPNGSGKTTTLKMLLGLLHPTKGHALLLGGNGADPKINAHIGFLPEESYLYRFLNARETLDFYGRLFGLSRDVRRMRIEALLDMVGLKAVASRPVGTYSKGMARRIGLAQALINDPDLLILDEPTTGLDPIGTRQIKDLILKLVERGKTILLCSHLLADVEDVCHRIAILYGGKIQAQGRVKELLQQTDRRQITTDAVSDAAIERIKQILDQERVTFEISSPLERLETFFIHTVVEAQQQAKPTSGAVSTTRIGDFLTGVEPSQSLLDKLVAAPQQPQIAPTAPRTEKVAETELPKGQPRKDLLRELTKPTAPDAEPVAPSPVQASEDKQAGPEQTRKNVLDALTGRSASEQTKRTDKGDRESGDA